jgi:hypothetical protein
MQALADQNGWLRARRRPGDPSNWNDPQVLADVIGDIVARPLATATGGRARPPSIDAAKSCKTLSAMVA